MRKGHPFFRKAWHAVVRRQPAKPAVVVHDPAASKPHDLDDPFFDRKSTSAHWRGDRKGDPEKVTSLGVPPTLQLASPTLSRTRRSLRAFEGQRGHGTCQARFGKSIWCECTERQIELRVLTWTKRNEWSAQMRRAVRQNTVQRRRAMPVVILWGLPVLIVLGGGVYLLTHLH
jgi:hypothetical protein